MFMHSKSIYTLASTVEAIVQYFWGIEHVNDYTLIRFEIRLEFES